MRSGARRESNLVRTIRVRLKEDFPGCFVLKIADRMTRGIPDLIVVWRGQTLFVETKAEGNLLSSIQEYTRDEILVAGGHHVVAYCYEDVVRAIRGSCDR